MKKLIFLSAVIVMMSLSSCEVDYYKGSIVYRQGYENTLNNYVAEQESELASYYEEIMAEVKKLDDQYRKEWQIEYSSNTLDEGLKEADKQALAQYGPAVTDMMYLVETYKAKLKPLEYNKGSFKLVYKFKISRDKVIQESEEFIFEYPVPEENPDDPYRNSR